VYNFAQTLTKLRIEVLKMCLMLEFGFTISNNINEFSLVVDMIKFIE